MTHGRFRQKVTTFSGEGSDRDAKRTKGHHFDGGSIATGGHFRQKITTFSGEGSDRDAKRTKGHHFDGGSIATGGHFRQKITTFSGEGSDRDAKRTKGHHFDGESIATGCKSWQKVTHALRNPQQQYTEKPVPAVSPSLRTPQGRGQSAPARPDPQGQTCP